MGGYSQVRTNNYTSPYGPAIVFTTVMPVPVLVPEYDKRLLAIAPAYPVEGFGHSQVRCSLMTASCLIHILLQDEYDAHRGSPGLLPCLDASASTTLPLKLGAPSVSPDLTTTPTYSPEKEAEPETQRHSGSPGPIMEYPWWRRKRWLATFAIVGIAVIAAVVAGAVCGTRNKKSGTSVPDVGQGGAAPQSTVIGVGTSGSPGGGGQPVAPASTPGTPAAGGIPGAAPTQHMPSVSSISSGLGPDTEPPTPSPFGPPTGEAGTMAALPTASVLSLLR